MSIPLRPLLVTLAVIAVVVVIVLLAVGAFGGGDEAGDEAQQAQKSQTGRISAQDLRVGDCVTDARATTGDVTTFNAVDCAKPHDGEVYTLIELEGTSYPGQEFLTAKGNRGCRARLKR
ncbi:MAG TPA: septum formation family protein, partial [Solirubrobacteraceae bacterium]|nr:septum formation family protein [Solirubrobacteraceae bacterium]